MASAPGGIDGVRIYAERSVPQLGSDRSLVEVTLHVHGKGSVNELAAALSEVHGVDSVVADDVNSASE